MKRKTKPFLMGLSILLIVMIATLVTNSVLYSPKKTDDISISLPNSISSTLVLNNSSVEIAEKNIVQVSSQLIKTLEDEYSIKFTQTSEVSKSTLPKDDSSEPSDVWEIKSGTFVAEAESIDIEKLKTSLEEFSKQHSFDSPSMETNEVTSTSDDGKESKFTSISFKSIKKRNPMYSYTVGVTQSEQVNQITVNFDSSGHLLQEVVDKIG